MHILVGDGISKTYKGRMVLDNVNFEVSRGGAVGIAGSTGSGKSTLLRILAGLIEPDSGAVCYEGKKIEGPLTKLLPGHERIAYLSQHFELRNNYRVEEIFEYSNKLEQAEAEEIFVHCEVSHLLKRRTDELSGGEKQRIALARILITRPDILLLDEPFSNLDLIQKTSLKSVLAKVTAAFNLTTVLVSHDPADLLPFAEIMHIMQNGRILQSGTAMEVYHHPADAYVAGLLGQFSLMNEVTANLLEAQGFAFVEKCHFLRPEMMKIVSENNGHLNGVVEKTWFTGPFKQAKVLSNDSELIVNHNDPYLTAGSKVGILFCLYI